MSDHFRQRLVVIALMLLGGADIPARAQWTYRGLAGPFLRAMQIHEEYLYVGNDRGLFRQHTGQTDTTWTSLGLDGRSVRAFEILGPDTLLAVVYLYEDGQVHGQQLFRTVDGGVTWLRFAEQLREEHPDWLFEFIRQVPGREQTFLAGGFAPLAISRDGGESWQPVSGKPDAFGWGTHFLTFDPVRPDVVWSGGESNILQPFLLHSSYGGDTWQIILLNLGGDNAAYAMKIDPTNPELLYIGVEGAVVRSTNGGQTWSRILSPTAYEYFTGLAISGTDPARIYASGIRNALDQRLTLYISDDRGESWTVETFGEISLWFGTEDLAVWSGPGADTVFLGSRYAGVYAYTAPVSTAQEPEDDTPSSASRLYPNFPNPFPSATEIRFSLETAASVQLTIYDLLGREVERLVDGPLPSGLHRVTWTAAARPNGTYLLRLETPLYSATRTLVLVNN